MYAARCSDCRDQPGRLAQPWSDAAIRVCVEDTGVLGNRHHAARAAYPDYLLRARQLVRGCVEAVILHKTAQMINRDLSGADSAVGISLAIRIMMRLQVRAVCRTMLCIVMQLVPPPSAKPADSEPGPIRLH